MRASMVALTFLAAAVAGCGFPMPWDGDTPTIEGTEWRAVQVRGGSPLGITDLRLTLGPGRLTGFAGCNAFASSTLAIGGGSLEHGKPVEFGSISSDDAVCDQPVVMQQERAFIEDLAAVEELRFEDGLLILAGPDVELRFQQVPFRR